MFARAESLVHAPTHLLYLARSYSKINQLVRARETYMRIIKEQLPSSAPPQFRDAQTAAQEELRSVEPRIAKLTIQVNGAADAKDLVVSIDGKPVPAVMIGVPQPVDPGEHRIEGVATGKRAKAQSVALRDGERSSVALQMENDATAVAPPPPPPTTPGGAPASEPSHVTTAPPDGPPTSSTPPPAAESAASGGPRSYALGGVGIAAGLIGAGSVVFGVVSLSDSSNKRNQADAACNLGPTGKCQGSQAEVNKLDSDADSARTRGIVGLVAGGVFVAGGVTMVIYGFGKSDTRTGSLTPIVGPSYLGLRGRF
jgi:hypothetical protein